MNARSERESNNAPKHGRRERGRREATAIGYGEMPELAEVPGESDQLPVCGK